MQATRPGKSGALTHGQAMRLLDSLLRFPVQLTTVDMVLAAAEARTRYRISYWDAAVIVAARMLGCAVILSEDLAHGRDYDGVRVEDPFRA